MKTKNAFVVSTTHWDREWYWSQERFRIRLVELIDDLLEIFNNVPQYLHYMLDGQVIPLEDYLEIKPENIQKLKVLVENGKLSIGPWYILPDVFLVSGESLIRNLLIGNIVSKEFGNVMDVGYLPDTFSHIRQMPQILKGCNLNEYLFMRGMGREYNQLGTEFWWEGPDGSRVFTTYLIEGYFNAGGLGFQDAFIDFRYMKPDFSMACNKMSDMMTRLSKVYKSNVYLLFNGSDHTDPQKELPEILNFLNDKFEDVLYTHSSIREYLKNREQEKIDLPVYCGEFTGNIHHLIVRSVFSTRTYLKQYNFKCQNLLEKYAESISSLAFLEVTTDFTSNLKYAWKTLLKNHPHDSISGCSVDEVHRDMMNRFERVQQVAEYVTEKSISALSKEIKCGFSGQPLLIFNPLNWERDEVIRAKILIPKSGSDNTNYSKQSKLIDNKGNSVSFQILRQYEKSIIELNDWKLFTIIEIEFVAKIPPVGYSVFYLVQEKTNLPKSVTKINSNSIENKFYKISINKNGSLKIYYKPSKVTYNDFNLFEDTEDDGDEYTYSFVENSKTHLSSNVTAKTSIYEKNRLSSTLQIEINFRLPESLDVSRKKRSKKMVNNKITSYITLSADCDRIDIKTELQNNSKDHRLRILFPSRFSDYRNYAGGHFDVINRPEYFPDKPSERQKIEYYATQHFQDFVTITDDKHGFTVITKGLQEYEILKKDSTLAISLLRSVGWLNKNNLMTRWRMAGPDIETPEAQCLGLHIFEYSIILHKQTWENSFKSALNFVNPLLSQSIQRGNGKLPDEMSILRLTPEDLIISALKISEKKDGVIIRFYNIKDHDITGTITLYKIIKKCFLANLLEEEIEEMTVSDNEINLTVLKHKIISLKLIF